MPLGAAAEAAGEVGRRAVLAKLERQIVIRSGRGSGRGLIGRGRSRSLVCGSGGSLIRRSRSADGGAFSVSAAEQLHVVGDYFGHELLLALLVVVGPGADASFYVDLAALADELLREVCELPPKDEVVPLGVFAQLSAAVAVAVCGGKGECGYFSALSALGGSLIKVTYFRVSSNVTD